MRYYESLYIINPNYEDNRLDETMKMVSEKCSNYGLKIINHRIWGKKRLAYSIQKHKYGSFILLHFECKSIEKLKEFDRFMILQNDILRNQTVVLSKKPQIHTEDERKLDDSSTKNNDLPKEEVNNKNVLIEKEGKEETKEEVEEQTKEEVEEQTKEEAEKETKEEVEEQTKEEVEEEAKEETKQESAKEEEK